jgi:predicted adenylyl cyclase CyaB
LARNIEIKARIVDVTAVTARAAALSGGDPVHIPQDDTFFNCANGRLKLRAFSRSSGELIFYRRANDAGPKESFYVISQTSEVASLREALTLAYGQCGRVRKQRTLYLVGRTRIHIDEVEGLGNFLELEVVLAEHETNEVGLDEALALMKKLEIESAQLVQGAYVDLLAADKPFQ